MRKTPKGLRTHIGLFGRRNVGKSSLLNAFTRQNVSIVSKWAGTTTDPVEKPMEVLPLGPVLFIDTAGIDDHGDLGNLRVEKTRKIFRRTDLGLIVTDGEWGPFEDKIYHELTSRGVPILVVHNKSDLHQPSAELCREVEKRSLKMIKTSVPQQEGILELRQGMLDSIPQEWLVDRPILGDLIQAGDLVVFVVPIDKEAPRGRLIMPQVQSIRDTLDHNAISMVVKESKLSQALDMLKKKPELVVTDSQAFQKVAEDTPKDVPLTSFSILFSRFKGDLLTQAHGARYIDQLQSGDRVLIAESCSHHPIEEDIGRVKIPRWLKQYTGCDLEFQITQGHDFPEDLSTYSLVIQCGGCKWNRKEILNRIMACQNQGVAISNYGLIIAQSLGILDRALSPFPQITEALDHAFC
ncbi:MAG: [FeFe] hydrogenase H-cluster maturation GTPase HydF [Acidobacteria bacterium]|nr:MAG: [FeFe] hydrogenase H-cluster maturation GTPase HydF [Acidobacteriota bacterium]